MPIKEWSTNYSGAYPIYDADPVTGSMPDIDEETAFRAWDSDEMRSSQPEALRDKVHTVCKLTGDSVNAPAGSLAEILDRDYANGDARLLHKKTLHIAGRHPSFPYIGKHVERPLRQAAGDTGDRIQPRHQRVAADGSATFSITRVRVSGISSRLISSVVISPIPS